MNANDTLLNAESALVAAQSAYQTAYDRLAEVQLDCLGKSADEAARLLEDVHREIERAERDIRGWQQAVELAKARKADADVKAAAEAQIGAFKKIEKMEPEIRELAKQVDRTASLLAKQFFALIDQIHKAYEAVPKIKVSETNAAGQTYEREVPLTDGSSLGDSVLGDRRVQGNLRRHLWARGFLWAANDVIPSESASIPTFEAITKESIGWLRVKDPRNQKTLPPPSVEPEPAPSKVGTFALDGYRPIHGEQSPPPQASDVGPELDAVKRPKRPSITMQVPQ